MNWLDLVIVALLMVNFAVGYLTGFLRRLIAFLGLFVGVGFATLASPKIANGLIKTTTADNALWIHAGFYLMCVLAVVVLFEGMGVVYSRMLSQYTSVILDNISGALAGLILGSMQVAVLLIMGVNLLSTHLPAGYPYPSNFGKVQATFQESGLAMHFYRLEPTAHLLLSPVLPGNLQAYFTTAFQ
jgi:uncharacterized membrane protein required for colicin V production